LAASEPSYPAGRAGVTVDPDEAEERRGELVEATSYLESKGIKPQTVELHAMDIGKAIVDQAREGGADLIVVGTGRKNVAKRLILGSVSTKVVHEAPCDVLVVR
jgi:nucleotide-binding universal stress UspA family protein